MHFSTDKEIAKMSIYQAVLPENGGNGLATKSFRISKLFRWETLEKGAEVLIADGKLVSQTRLKFDLLGVIGRDSVLRRVLIHPRPLSLKIKFQHDDGTKDVLWLDVIYEVANPLGIIGLQDPIDRLISIIRGKAFKIGYDKIQNNPDEFAESLNDEPGVKNYFKNICIAITEFEPDPEITQVKLDTSIAKEKRELNEINREINLKDANIIGQIDEANMLLTEQFTEREHERQMERLKYVQEQETLRALVNAVPDILRKGGKIEDIRKLRNEVLPNNSPIPRIQSSSRHRGKVEEEIALQRLEGIDDMEIQEGQKGVIEYADIWLSDGTRFIFKCSNEYPDEPPKVTVTIEGKTIDYHPDWRPGNRLANVIHSWIHNNKGNS